MDDADSDGSQDCDYNNIGLCTGIFHKNAGYVFLRCRTVHFIRLMA